MDIKAPRRNKGYTDTHRTMIETAVRLIAENGAEALSVAAVARAMGINRTTVYYHFDSREALLDAVTQWANEELAKGMDFNATQPERISKICGFVLDNPELIKLWIDRFIAGPDIHDSYILWDALVEGTGRVLRANNPDAEIDAEVYCVMMLTASIIGPRVFANAVGRGQSKASIVERFVKEHQRALARDGLVR